MKLSKKFFMSSKFIPAKYLAVVLLGIIFLVLASLDAFSQSEISISGPDTFLMNAGLCTIS